MKTENKRLSWQQKNPVKYFCFNADNDLVGFLVLQNVGRHRHWCWYQSQDVYMSPGCLEEVREKQKELFKQR